MKFRIICVGKIKDLNLLSLVNEYTLKINYDAKLEIIEIKDSDKTSEGKKLIEHIDKSRNYVVILSEEGNILDSLQFSKLIKTHSLMNKDIDFVIGGPFGLSDEVKQRSDIILSLSRMTFTHEMARLFLVEQIYRALSIINKKKYHKN